MSRVLNRPRVKAGALEKGPSIEPRLRRVFRFGITDPGVQRDKGGDLASPTSKYPGFVATGDTPGISGFLIDVAAPATSSGRRDVYPELMPERRMRMRRVQVDLNRSRSTGPCTLSLRPREHGMGSHPTERTLARRARPVENNPLDRHRSPSLLLPPARCSRLGETRFIFARRNSTSMPSARSSAITARGKHLHG